MKVKKSTLIPLLLLVYLAVMAALGYGDFARGTTSPGEYFGIIAVSLLVIVLLYFNLRYRDKLRRRRRDESVGFYSGQDKNDKTKY